MLLTLKRISLGIICTGFLATTTWAMTPEERISYRAMLLVALPDVPSFDDWIRTTEELPPDFDTLPRRNALPDPLNFVNGKPVKTAADWKTRREEILQLYQKHVWGTLPPPLKLDHADVQESSAQGYRVRTVVLHVGPDGKGTMHLTLQIPEGAGPFPVVMGPGMIGDLAGPTTTIRRHGYVVASFAGSDANDDSAAIGKLYPDSDCGAVPRRAWSASCVVDYLLNMPEVDGKRIAVAGAWPNGSTAVIAGALDERISAVIDGSPGIGGTLPFRLAGDRHQVAGVETLTRAYPAWFHPRLRFFTGREDRLPVDGNLLLATLAPRPYFMVAENNDIVSSVWGDEQSLHSADRVYQLLKTPEKLGIHRVSGYGGGIDWDAAMAFLDVQFGRSKEKWTNQWIFPWDFEKWKKTTGESVDLAKFPEHKPGGLLDGGTGPITTKAGWETKAAEVRKNMQWMLGDATPAANPKLTPSPLPPVSPDVADWVIRRSTTGPMTPDFGWLTDDASATASRPITFNGVKGTLYYPARANPGAKLPTVIFLHGYSYPLGYMWASRTSWHPIQSLVTGGYAVLAFDQCGFGTRMNEAAAFFDKTPHWSQMGRMVQDARAAVDVLSKDPAVDASRISLLGYSLGANVALHTAALEPRVHGVVAVCGFTPMRTDTADKGAGGIGRFSVEQPLLPRLGFFLGQEAKIPYDYDEMLASLAPRPVYVLAPKYDRDANQADVHAAILAARKVYGLYDASDKLRSEEPWDYNQFAGDMEDRILLWMGKNMK